MTDHELYKTFLFHLEVEKLKYNRTYSWYCLAKVSEFIFSQFIYNYHNDDKLREKLVKDYRSKKIDDILNEVNR